MKQFFSTPEVPQLAVQVLPAFFWVRQVPNPIWDVARATCADQLQAVGTATRADDGSGFLDWSSSGTISMGGATTTLVGPGRLSVKTV